MIRIAVNQGRREITMPLEKLSDEDRELLNSVPVAVENPFETSD